MFMVPINTTVIVTVGLQHVPGWQVRGIDDVRDPYTLFAAYMAIIEGILRQVSGRNTADLSHDEVNYLIYKNESLLRL
jgi:hypothetical protein